MRPHTHTRAHTARTMSGAEGGKGEAPLAGEGMDQELYGAGDRYAGYVTSLPLEGEEDEDAPMVGGPRCVCCGWVLALSCCACVLRVRDKEGRPMS